MKQGADIVENKNYEDVLVLSNRSEVVPARVKLDSKFTKNIELKFPFISASDENITMAKLGGIGIVNPKLSMAEQIAEIAKVKAVELTEEEKVKATIDSEGKLAVAAMVKLSSSAYDDIVSLAASKLDVVIIESMALNVKELALLIEKVRLNFPELQIVAGNAYSADDVRILAEAGAEAVKIGNRKQIVEQLGVDVLNVKDILDIAGEAQVAQIPVIFDDNITSSASIAKIIALGCSAIVIKDLFSKGNIEQIVNSISNNLKLSIAYTGNESLKDYIDNAELSIIS